MIWDLIVIGVVGGVGSVVFWSVVKCRVNVLGFDWFEFGYGYGSFYGDIRVIRMVYFEYLDYVSLF